MLEACRLLLDGVSVQANSIDRWQWDPDIHDGYTVRGAYQILTDSASSTIDTTRDLVWHKQVPLKVSIVAWRLLKDRLPKGATFIGAALYRSREIRVCLAAVTWSQRPICSSIVMYSGRYGSMSGRGLVWNPSTLLIISHNSYIIQVHQSHAARFFNCFGFCVCG